MPVNSEDDLVALARTLLDPPCTALQCVPANCVLNRCRLDVVLKYLFFRSLTGLERRDVWEPFYRKHILERTKGFEPRDSFQKRVSSKRSVDDYVTACETLLQSFQSGGFDANFPVPVSSEDKLLNGAHRLACALATNQPILIAPGQLGSSRPWGFQWFADRAYPPELLAALLYHYAHLTTKAIGVLILWGPTAAGWSQILTGLKEQVGIVGWLDFCLESNPAAFQSLVHDVYALQWEELEDRNIRRKAIFLNQARRIFRVVLVEDLFDQKRAFSNHLRTVRTGIRRQFAHVLPEEAFCTCHAACSEAESAYLVELLLGQGSRKYQSLRAGGQPRSQFGHWLLQLPGELARHGLSREDICIVGSSPLEVIGLREATDIDITVTPGFRKRFGPGVTHLTPWLDIVTKEYGRSLDRPHIPDKELIKDPKHHFWFRGFKFADVDIVLRRKAYQKRPKDLADIERAKGFFGSEGVKAGRGLTVTGTELIGYLVEREKELNRGRL